MTKFILPTIIIISSLSCNAQKNIEKFGFDDLGIAIEKFDSINVDENRYNHNNSIYTVGRKFTFSYFYADKTGAKYLMTKNGLNDWGFEKMEIKDPKSIFEIILSVNSGLSPFIQQLPDYNQTVITYDFKLYDGSLWTNEMTGIIENSKNVWMHPPRTDFFKILEINPFPYIKAPFKIGNEWTWKLKFGDHWKDKRWLLWQGENENIYSYKITNKVKLKTKLGILDCFIVVGEAKSSLGKTNLKSYFNEKFGFVKLDYTNIDGTKTIIELISTE